MKRFERNSVQRRDFLRAGMLCGGALALPGMPGNAQGVDSATLRETLEIPVVGRFDVIVAGAGPAGVAAALAAAREGARTLLIEKNGCLGGIWTAGLLCWILDQKQKTGILDEIRRRLEADETGFDDRGGNGAFAYEPEAMKLLLETMCLEAGLSVRLGTWVVGGAVEGRRATHVVTESKSGRQAWAGDVFIDCTGDGDLAARLGCGFDLGDGPDQTTQPMSLLALVGGVRLDVIRPMVRIESGSASKHRLREAIESTGVDVSYKLPSLFPIYDDLFALMANHQYGACGLDAGDLTEATLRARRETGEIIRGLRSLGGPWRGLRLLATAEQIGVREGRRIHGRYKVTTEDLVRGARHDDAVCRVHFGVDVHSTSRSQDVQGRSYSRGVKSRPYDIPMRALIAKDIDGLMMAGRCISGDFIAHSSYRVTGNSVPMGEAAGMVAARAVAADCLPSEVAYHGHHPAT